MKIGSYELNNPLILGPMAGVTDWAFRTVCAELGADITVTEMVSSRALVYRDQKSAKLLRKNTPGPFTFILEANSNVPKLFKTNKKTVGVRVPDNVIVRSIVERLGNPILSASVKNPNEETEDESITDPSLIQENLRNVADIVIDGGIGGIEGSTVVDCTSGEWEIIRQGKGELDTNI